MNAPRSRVRIPADTDRPDRLLGNLTARQLAILSIAGIALWATYIATRRVVPLAAFAAVAVPCAGAATLVALGRVEGLPADRLLVAVLRHFHSPRRLVPAPDGVRPAPAWAGTGGGPLPAPLRLPLAGIGADGVVDLGADGLAVLCKASSVTFSLRTPTEQEALTAGFGRFLNSASEPIQLLVRAEPVELDSMIGELLDAAPGLPHPGLEKAARQHAKFLSELAAARMLLRREVLVVLHQPPGEGAADRLRRRAEEAVSALAAAGVSLSVLDGTSAATCITRAIDPGVKARPSGCAAPSETITRSEQ